MKHSAPESITCDVAIIGGGIVGAGLFRDLCLHGLSVQLFDRGDFASQTSNSSSKMLHGGIRYLEQFEFGLIKEALTEKNLWLKMAPHICRELPFCMPIYRQSDIKRWQLSVGLKIYDLLSGLQNSPHHILNAPQTQNRIPLLASQGLKGSGIYYDAIVDDGQLALECLWDGECQGTGRCWSYHRVNAIDGIDDKRPVLHITDTLAKKNITCQARYICYCLGPFTDDVLKAHKISAWNPVIVRSKGIHLWMKQEALALAHPVVLRTKDERVVFVIPQKGMVLVGTTETITHEDMFNIQAKDDEVDYLLANLKEFFPQANVAKDQILATFAGVRPLVSEGLGEGPGDISREHKVYYPRDNIVVISGGKYTTFRTMVQEVAQTIASKETIPYDPNKTLRPLRQKSSISLLREEKICAQKVRQIFDFEKPRTFDDLVKRRIGILNRKHWDYVTEQKFEDFFGELMPELQSELDVFNPSELHSF